MNLRTSEAHHRTAGFAWELYQEMLSDGVAREVARNILPLSVYTSFYVTMNLRGLLNFLSLRWAHPDSKTPTFPLWEIEQCAKQMNVCAAQVAPTAMELFDQHGRVAP
jgi:thymidylate synthase (FAD)